MASQEDDLEEMAKSARFEDLAAVDRHNETLDGPAVEAHGRGAFLEPRALALAGCEVAVELRAMP